MFGESLNQFKYSYNISFHVGWHFRKKDVNDDVISGAMRFKMW